VSPAPANKTRVTYDVLLIDDPPKRNVSTPKVTPKDLVKKVIGLQRADGHWKYSKELAEIVTGILPTMNSSEVTEFVLKNYLNNLADAEAQLALTAIDKAKKWLVSKVQIGDECAA
jgi:hypothetical protein